MEVKVIYICVYCVHMFNYAVLNHIISAGAWDSSAQSLIITTNLLQRHATSRMCVIILHHGFITLPNHLLLCNFQYTEYQLPWVWLKKKTKQKQTYHQLILPFFFFLNFNLTHITFNKIFLIIIRLNGNPNAPIELSYYWTFYNRQHIKEKC